MRVTVKCL